MWYSPYGIFVFGFEFIDVGPIHPWKDFVLPPISSPLDLIPAVRVCTTN